MRILWFSPRFAGKLAKLPDFIRAECKVIKSPFVEVAGEILHVSLALTDSKWSEAVSGLEGKPVVLIPKLS